MMLFNKNVMEEKTIFSRFLEFKTFKKGQFSKLVLMESLTGDIPDQTPNAYKRSSSSSKVTPLSRWPERAD